MSCCSGNSIDFTLEKLYLGWSASVIIPHKIERISRETRHVYYIICILQGYFINAGTVLKMIYQNLTMYSQWHKVEKMCMFYGFKCNCCIFQIFTGPWHGTAYITHQLPTQPFSDRFKIQPLTKNSYGYALLYEFYGCIFTGKYLL